MKKSRLLGKAWICAIFLIMANASEAVPVVLDTMLITVDKQESSTGTTFTGNQNFSGTMTIPWHEYTSRYTFDGASYGADFFIPALSDGFTQLGNVEVLVNNDLDLTSSETGGFLTDGTYDWIEILVSTAVDVCPSGSSCPPYTPGSPTGTEDAQEWTLAIFGASDWFTDGSVIPDTLPVDYKALLVGLNFNDNGAVIGEAYASASAVPLPAAAWLFLSGMLGLLGISSRKKVV